MKTLKKVLVYLIIIIGLLYLIQTLLIAYLSKDNVIKKAKQTNKIKYYYWENDSDTTANEGLFIENLKYKDSLKMYYEKVLNGLNPYINFESHPVPMDTAIHIVEPVKEDTNIVKVIFYYRTDVTNEENKVAYVLSKFLHDNKYKRQCLK